MRLFISALTFIILSSFFTIISWIGGFNFDARNKDVAFGFAFSFVLTCLGTGVAYAFYPEITGRKK